MVNEATGEAVQVSIEELPARLRDIVEEGEHLVYITREGEPVAAVVPYARLQALAQLMPLLDDALNQAEQARKYYAQILRA